MIRAVRELGKLGDAEAVNPLVTLLGTTTQTDLIDALIRALADLGDVRAIPTLKACAARAPVGTTRIMADRAVQMILKKQIGDGT